MTRPRKLRARFGPGVAWSGGLQRYYRHRHLTTSGPYRGWYELGYTVEGIAFTYPDGGREMLGPGRLYWALSPVQWVSLAAIPHHVMVTAV